MGISPPNWQWCQSCSEDERVEFFNGCKKEVRVLKKHKHFAPVMNFHDDLPPKQSNLAVCVIPANEFAQQQLEETKQSLLSYAKKCNADYIELSGDQCEDWPMANKYRLSQVTELYEKTLYVDCDVVIKKDAPNIFELTPDDKISIFNELEIHDSQEWIKEEQDLVRIKLGLEKIEREVGSKMLNAGVMVIPRSVAAYYQQPENPYPRLWCFDQQLLTLTLPEDKLFELDEKFNTEYVSRTFWSKARDAHFVHVNNCRDIQFRKRIMRRVSDDLFSEIKPNDFIAAGTFITTADMVNRATRLCEKVPPVKGVIGLPRSGMIPASVVSVNLSVPLYSLSGGNIKKLNSRSEQGGSRMSEFKPADNDLPFLVVDDTSYSGTELKRTRKLLKEKYPDKNFIFTTIYTIPDVECRTDDEENPLLDIPNAYAPYPHILEWNFFNAHTTSHGIFDLDGVFCEDCPTDLDKNEKDYIKWMENVKPIKSRIPQLFPCMAICTARLEKYREETERWLEKHGIRYRKLIMFEGTREQRDQNHVKNVSEYKSKHFNEHYVDPEDGYISSVGDKAYGHPVFFVESCPNQSRLINSKKVRFNQWVISINEKRTI